MHFAHDRTRTGCDVTLFLHKTIYVACLLFLIQPGALGLTAHLSYSTSDSHDVNSLPKDVTMTLVSGAASVPSSLHLRRVDHLRATVPLYTMTLDNKGHYECTKESLTEDNDTGFYQDVENEALIELKRDMKRDGVLTMTKASIAGRIYRLTQTVRRKRRANSNWSPSALDPTEIIYNLHEQGRNIPPSRDVLIAPSEVQLTVQEESFVDVPNPIISSSSSSSSTSSSLPSSTNKTQFPSNVPPQISRNDSPKVQLQPSSSSSSSSSASSSSSSQYRHKRQNSYYYIDVVAVVDYGIYRRFLDSSPSRTAALEDVREYFAFIFSGMDLRYQSISEMATKIRIRVTKIIVAEVLSAATFTERHRVSDSPWDEVDAQLALQDFSTFVSTSGSDMVSPYDHVMLFTGYDLTSSLNGGAKTNSTTGLAYTSTMCRTDGKSVSVVEDLGGFQSVDTASHELGHGLSAQHDGDNNTCRSSDRYIMAGGSSRETSLNKLNPWKFSFCSVTYFTSFINKQLFTSRGRSCLTLALPISASVLDVSGQLPGQMYSPDDQCRMIYGSASRLCRGTEFGLPSDICSSMFCYDPSTTGTCYEQTAARGTTCGNGKICLNGECISDNRAPDTEEDCVFGDQPGTAFDGQTCSDFVANFPGYCYQPVVRGRCCASCQGYKRFVQDCEYGDSVHRCSSNVCTFATTQYLRQCCGTCNYGTSIPPPGTTSVTRPQTIRTTDPPSTSNPDACEDNPTVLINQLSCGQAVASSPRFCYQANVRQFCCKSCRAIKADVQGCEYGDLYPTSCSRLTSCTGYESQCCSTCFGAKTTTTPVFGTGIITNTKPVTTGRQTTPPPTTGGGLGTQPTSSTTLAVCVDNPNIRVNNLPCQRAVEESPKYCYQANVQEVCCLSCKRAHTGSKGCEYGDRFPETCQVLSDCTGLESQCCNTCKRAGNSAPGRSWNNRLPERVMEVLLILTILLLHNVHSLESVL